MQDIRPEARPDTRKKSPLRERLLHAGMDEINRHGMADFSIRRIAAACGVSPTAPYKHFRDKQAFIAEILHCVQTEWEAKQEQILRTYPGSRRQQLVEFSVSYVRFLVENPHLSSILMMRDDAFDRQYHSIRSELSDKTRQLVTDYCAEVHMDEETKQRKLYVVRALIYGAALLFDKGELPYTEESLAFVRQNIDREFDLP